MAPNSHGLLSRRGRPINSARPSPGANAMAEICDCKAREKRKPAAGQVAPVISADRLH